MYIPEFFRDRPYASRHFEQIINHARQHHPFYQRWITDPDKEIPLLTRETILDNNEALLNGHAVTATTSGSTGVPVRVAQQPERGVLESRQTALFVNWLGGPLPRTRIVYFGDKQTPEDGIDVKASIEEQLYFIQHRRHFAGAVAITTYPTNAERLAKLVIDQNIDMSWVQRFGCFAEVFEPEQELLIREAFPNAQIWSTYSSMEFGMIAGRCPHESDYHHIMAQKLGIEVLNDENRQCKPGEVGRLVITDYFNHAMPLIRYDIGDLGAPATCPCGQIDLPALTDIAGKIRGALLHNNGDRVLFADLSVQLRDIRGIKQYQVVQNTLDQFDIKLVVLPESNKGLIETEIDRTFNRHFGYLVKLCFQYLTEIPRGDNGKFYASICNIG